MMESLKVRIRGFILQKFPAAQKKPIGFGDELLQGGMIDSLGILEVVEFLEHEFAITVHDGDLVPENFQTVERIADFVEHKLEQDSASRLG